MLYFTPAHLESLKQRDSSKSPKRRDSQQNGVIESLRMRSADLQQEELYTQEFADSVEDQHGNFYTIAQQLNRFAETLGLLYAITEDAQALAKLREALLHYAQFSRWTGPTNPRRTPPWHAGLETAEIVGAYAIAYDFIHEIGRAHV